MQAVPHWQIVFELHGLPKLDKAPFGQPMLPSRIKWTLFWSRVKIKKHWCPWLYLTSLKTYRYIFVKNTFEIFYRLIITGQYKLIIINNYFYDLNDFIIKLLLLTIKEVVPNLSFLLTSAFLSIKALATLALPPTLANKRKWKKR